MSRRLALRRMTARAIASQMADLLLKLDSEELWTRLMDERQIPEEQLQEFRRQLREDLVKVEQKGHRERELVGKGLRALLDRFGPREGGE